MENLKIHTALTNINRKVEAIAKNRKNAEQHYSFRGIDDTYNELHDLFAKEGVFILSKIVSSTREERKSASGKTLIYTIATYEFSFVADDGSRETITLQGEGMDTGDKSLNKAFSAALKYALLSMFLIPTDEAKDSEIETYEVKPKPQPNIPAKPKPLMPEDRFTKFIGQVKNEPTKAGALIVLARKNFTLSEKQEGIIQEWEDNLNNQRSRSV